jgi:hypothetical protein
VDWDRFLLILGIGIALVVVQGISSWFDGYLTPAQLRSRGIVGWSFMQHGGMWSDVFIISPVVAYIVSKYNLEYTSWRGILMLLGMAAFVLLCIEFWRRGGIATPEAHTHDGKTTLTGWVHGFFFLAAFWTCAQLYLNLTEPLATKWDIVFISILLTPFFYLGAAKFSHRWVFDATAKWIVGTEVIVLWGLTALRLLRM